MRTMLANVLKRYERVKDHNSRDHISHLVKHATETGA